MNINAVNFNDFVTLLGWTYPGWPRDQRERAVQTAVAIYRENLTWSGRPTGEIDPDGLKFLLNIAFAGGDVDAMRAPVLNSEEWAKAHAPAPPPEPTPEPIPTPIPPTAIPSVVRANFLTLTDDVTSTGFQKAPEQEQDKAIASCLKQDYTTMVIEAVRGFDDAFADASAVEAATKKLHAAGLGVWLNLTPKDPSVESKYASVAAYCAGLARLGQALKDDAIDHVALAVEFETRFRDFDDHPRIVAALTAAFPKAKRWIHFTTGVWGKPGHEVAYLKDCRKHGLTGFCYQYGPKVKFDRGGFTVTQSVMKSETKRLVAVCESVGLDFCAGEYSNGEPEAKSRQLGIWANEAGAEHLLNGGPGYDRTPPQPLPPGTVDAIDPRLVDWLNRDDHRVDVVGGWPITAKLKVSFPTHDSFEFRRIGPKWKTVPGSTIDSNGWVIFRGPETPAGRYTARTLDYWTGSSPRKGLDPPRPIWSLPRDGWHSKAGEVVYCVMTGPAREKFDGVKERTAIEKVVLPA